MTFRIKNRLKSLNKILSKEQTVILETALYSMVPVLLTKITGLFFNLLAASYFGTKNQGWNQFQLATSIPDMITNIFLGGTIASIVVPFLVASNKQKGKEAFLKLYNSIINTSVIFLSIVSIFLIITANLLIPFLLKLLMPREFASQQGDITIIISMMRVLLIPQIILGVSVLFSSGLNMFHRYLIPQISGLFFNIGRILSLIILLPIFHYSPWAIVCGVILGSILHLGIQIPLFLKIGLRYQFVLSINSDLINVFINSIPRSLALLMENLALTFNDFLAYTLSYGSLSSFNFANSLSLFIPNLFASTFATAAFTTLSELFEEKNYPKIVSVITKSLNEILFLALPFIITLLVLRIAVVRLSYGLLPNTGLDLDGTYQIAWVLFLFALGHIFICGKYFMYRVFYAAKNSVIPFLVSTGSFISTVILSIFFSNLFSHNSDYSIANTHFTIQNLLTRSTGSPAVGGIALAISISYSLEFFALIIIFHFREHHLNFRSLIHTIQKKFIAGGVMFIVMYLMYKTWNILAYALPTSLGNKSSTYVGSTTINLFLLTLITLITSFMVYYLVCLLLKVEELKILKKYLNPLFKLGGLKIN